MLSMCQAMKPTNIAASKSTNKTKAKSFIPKIKENGNTEESGKKEKSLEERELDWHRKRTKKALEIANEFFFSGTFDNVIMKHSAPKDTVVAMSLMFGIKPFPEMYVAFATAEYIGSRGLASFHRDTGQDTVKLVFRIFGIVRSRGEAKGYVRGLSDGNRW